MIDDCGNFLPVAYAELDNLIPKIQVGSQKVYLMRDIAQASISRSLPDFSVKDYLSKSATNRPVNPADISRQCSDIKKGLIDLARIYWLVVSNVTLRFPLSLDSREITGFTGRSTILEPFLNNYILDEVASKIIAINPQKSYVNPFKYSSKEIQNSFRDRLRSKLVGKQDVSSATDTILNRVEDAMTFTIGAGDMPLPPNKIGASNTPTADYLAPNMVTAIIAA